MESDYVTYSKSEIIDIQLRRSIRLYIDEYDYLSSLTLAGAAEEILGKLLIAKGDKPTIEKSYETFKKVEEAIWEEPAPNKKYFIDNRNTARNHLKHLINENGLVLDPELEARKMIGRTLENYFELYERKFELSEEFVEEWKKRF